MPNRRESAQQHSSITVHGAASDSAAWQLLHTVYRLCHVCYRSMGK
jgi:hypothetical protein